MSFSINYIMQIRIGKKLDVFRLSELSDSVESIGSHWVSSTWEPLKNQKTFFHEQICRKIHCLNFSLMTAAIGEQYKIKIKTR
jgi:hypothetical protein